MDLITIMSFVIDILRFIILAKLVIYSLFIKKQDILDDGDLEPLLMQNPLNYNELYNKNNVKKIKAKLTNAEENPINDNLSEIPIINNKLPLELSLDVKQKIIIRNHEFCYEIKICIDYGAKSYKVIRSLKDLITLEKTLLKEVNNKSYLFPPNFENVIMFSTKIDKDCEEIMLSKPMFIQKISSYLKNLVQYLEIFTIDLILFLEIPQPYKNSIILAHNDLVKQISENRYLYDKQINTKESRVEKFFDVFEIIQMQKDENNPDIYLIDIGLLEVPRERWKFQKKSLEVLDFLNQDSFLVNPEEEIIKLMEIKCNESKENLTNKDFLSFMNINLKISNLLKVYTEKDRCMINLLRFEVVDTLLLFNKQKKKQSFFYNILVECDELSDKKTVFFKNIYKKYKHFKELHLILVKKFKTIQNELPNLPEKNSFDLKEGLESYLKKLVKFQYIGQSLAFRRFLNVCFLKGSFIDEPFFEKNIKVEDV